MCTLIDIVDALWLQNEAMDLLIAILKSFPSCLRAQSINVRLFFQTLAACETLSSWTFLMYDFSESHASLV